MGVGLKPGIATIALRKYDIFHALDLAAEAGFLGVEIWGRPPHTPAEFDEEHTRRVRDRILANGLKPNMFGSYANPSLPDFEQKMEDSLKIAAILGARKIRVWAGDREPRDADPELWDQVACRLHEFALRAEDRGIKLAMETHSGTLCATPEGALRVIEQADAPNLKLNYQVVNFASPDLERDVRLLGDHIINVHAQNHRPSPIEEGRMEICWLEEGLVDYDTLLSLLAARGFRGFVEVEFLKGETVSEAAVLESLSRDSAYLRALTAKYTA